MLENNNRNNHTQDQDQGSVNFYCFPSSRDCSLFLFSTKHKLLEDTSNVQISSVNKVKDKKCSSIFKDFENLDFLEAGKDFTRVEFGNDLFL